MQINRPSSYGAASREGDAGSSATRYQRAEDDLAQARTLAMGFGLDTALIDNRMAAVRQLRSRLVAAEFQPIL